MVLAEGGAPERGRTDLLLAERVHAGSIVFENRGAVLVQARSRRLLSPRPMKASDLGDQF